MEALLTATTRAVVPRAAPGFQVAYSMLSLGLQMVWVTNLTFVPSYLEYRGARPSVIGLLIALGPLLALVIQPLVSHLSDRTRGALGPRWPYILGGAVIAAAAFVILSRAETVPMAAAALLLECVAMQIVSVCHRALLTDVFPASQYTTTAGLQSLFKEVGNLAGFALGALLLRMDRGYPFLGTAGAVLVFAIWPFIRMRPHDVRADAYDDVAPTAGRSTTRRWLYAAQCLWWFAIYVMTAFTVLFVVHVVYGIDDVRTSAARTATSHAMWLLVVANVAGLLAAVPLARIGRRAGTRRGLMLGVAFLAAAAATALFASRGSFVLAVTCCVLYGVGLAAIQVLSYIALIEHSPGMASGALAGVFGVLVSVPQIVATAAGGYAIDLSGSYRAPFVLGAAALILSAYCLTRTAEGGRA